MSNLYILAYLCFISFVGANYSLDKWVNYPLLLVSSDADFINFYVTAAVGGATMDAQAQANVWDQTGMLDYTYEYTIISGTTHMDKGHQGMYLEIQPAVPGVNDFNKKAWYKIDLENGQVEEYKNKTWENVGLPPVFPDGTIVKVKISIEKGTLSVALNKGPFLTIFQSDDFKN